MGLMGRLRRDRAVAGVATEDRAQVLMDSTATSIADVLNGGTSEGVTMKEALSMPAVWDAINFLSAAMAGLPIEVF